MSVSEDRKKALDGALAQITKNFGAGAAVKLGDNPLAKVKTTSTGSLAIDIAIGGGLPVGRIIEIYGPESSGKTLTCLQAIAEVQKGGGVAAFIDAEHALDPEWARKIGVNVDELIVSQPSSGEQALQIADILTRSKAVDLIVIDSVSALTPQKEIDGEMGDSMVGVQARLMSQGLRKLTGAANESETTIIFINQLREKIGVMFGSPETTTGGKALKFYASVRLDIRRIEQIKEGTDVIGARTRVKVVKNKVAPPFKQAEFDILYTKGNEGFSREGDIITYGVELGLIKKSGAWFTLAEDGSQLGQGKEKARVALMNNPELADRLDAEIRAKLLNKDATEPEVEADADLDALPDDEI
jgi:recombination protein RecA